MSIDHRALADLDGLSFRTANGMPHATELTRWSDAGLYTHDLDRSCFRLTDAGWKAAGQAA